MNQHGVYVGSVDGYSGNAKPLVVEAGGRIQPVGWTAGTTPDTLIKFASTLETDATWGISATKLYRARDGVNFTQVWAGAASLTLYAVAANPLIPACFVVGFVDGGNQWTLRLYSVTAQSVVSTLYSRNYSKASYPTPGIAGIASTELFTFIALSGIGDFLVAETVDPTSVNRYSLSVSPVDIAAWKDFCFQLTANKQVFRTQGQSSAQTLIVDESATTFSYNGIACDYSRDTVYLVGNDSATTYGSLGRVANASTVLTATAPVRSATDSSLGAVNIKSVAASTNIAGDVIMGTDNPTAPLLVASESAQAPAPLTFTGTVTAPVNHVSLDETGLFTYAHMITSAQGGQMYAGVTLLATGGKSWTLARHDLDSTLTAIVGITPSGYLYRAQPTTSSTGNISWKSLLNPVTDLTPSTYENNQPFAINLSATKLYIASEQGIIGVSLDMGLTRVSAAAVGSPRSWAAGGFVGGLAGNTSIFATRSPSTEQVYVSTDDWATSTTHVWYAGRPIKAFASPSIKGSDTFFGISNDANGQNAQVFQGSVAAISTIPTTIYTEPEVAVGYLQILQPQNSTVAFFILRTDGKIRITANSFTSTVLVTPPSGAVTPRSLSYDPTENFLYVCYAEGVWYAPVDLASPVWQWIEDGPGATASGSITGHFVNRSFRVGIISAEMGSTYTRPYL